MEELDNEGDLRILVSAYLKKLNPHRSVIDGIIRLKQLHLCIMHTLRNLKNNYFPVKVYFISVWLIRS